MKKSLFYLFVLFLVFVWNPEKASAQIMTAPADTAVVNIDPAATSKQPARLDEPRLNDRDNDIPEGKTAAIAEPGSHNYGGIYISAGALILIIILLIIFL